MASNALEKESTLEENVSYTDQDKVEAAAVSPQQDVVPHNYFLSPRFIGTVLAAGTSLFAVRSLIHLSNALSPRFPDLEG